MRQVEDWWRLVGGGGAETCRSMNKREGGIEGEGDVLRQ